MDTVKYISVLIQKMKKNSKNKDSIIKILVTIVFILLPIIDILRSTNIKDIELFGFAIIELVNIILIGLSFIISLTKFSKKDFKHLLIGTAIFLVYVFFHIKNIYKFDSSILVESNINGMIELYYILRVYILPFFLGCTLIKNKEIFNKKYYLNIALYLIMLISSVIILCNTFRFSYGTYESNNMGYIINKTNFFDVFNYEKNYVKLLTMGLFYSGNQIAMILFMLLPINIYNMYLKKNIKSLLLIIIQVFAMIIVGTKISSIGSILTLLATLFAYLFFLLIKKEKYCKKYLYLLIISIAVSTGLFTISPFSKTLKNSINDVDFNYGSNKGEIKKTYDTLNSNLSDEEFIKLLKEKDYIFKIDKVFYELYPAENDLSFWREISKRDRSINNDYRRLKMDIIKRVEERNNNKYDSLFGLGYTINFMDIERDYVYQYYLFGLFGLLILVVPYIFFFASNALKSLKPKNFKYPNIILLMSSFFGLISGYFSGHLFGWTTPMLILTFAICFERIMINNE